MKAFLGYSYKDRLTGFTGICTGRVEYLTGCNQALLQPRVSAEGAMRDSVWIVEQRLVQLADEPVTLDNGKTPGFDKPAPKM